MNSSAAHLSLENQSIRFIRGIGPRRLEALKRLGIQTVRDLCYFFPRQYEDRSHFQSIASLEPGREATIAGQVLALGVRPLRHMSLFEMKVGDETGMISAVWFNQPYLKTRFQMGDQVILSGKVDCFQDRLQINSPDYERLEGGEGEAIHTGRITPCYPLTEGLVQRSLRTAMKEVVDEVVPKVVHEFLPEEVRKRHRLVELKAAIQTMHFPDHWDGISEARRRLVFDEFFLFQLILLSKIRASQKQEHGIPFKNSAEHLEEFERALPFSMTDDQKQAIREIAKGVSGPVPANHLLQGEVGSGKTVVAAFFLFLAARNGVQGAFLVPTEILAEQHEQKLKFLFSSLGIKTALLTGSLEEAERGRVQRGAGTGAVSILIGTHALLSGDVRFHHLGFVVIDEQHRFGVRQRAHLLGRSPRPHLLVMSATPIPRTLALSLYGDFEVSTLKHLPVGRKAVRTQWIQPGGEKAVLAEIAARLKETEEQACLLFPIIDETERLDLQAAKQEYERLRRGVFAGLSVGLLHGRLSKSEREGVMKRFYSGSLKILVTTSIVEVGVDNPNVTFMVIEHAERFGLAQLHQMRGRIGRGEKESTCYLFGTPATEEGKRRFEIMTQTNDGFIIAEEDLALRGPGDFFGTRQSGAPFFRLANLVRDFEVLKEARAEAVRVLDQDPELVFPAHQALRAEVQTRKSSFQAP